jgi:hypothetical protein
MTNNNRLVCLKKRCTWYCTAFADHCAKYESNYGTKICPIRRGVEIDSKKMRKLFFASKEAA